MMLPKSQRFLALQSLNNTNFSIVNRHSFAWKRDNKKTACYEILHRASDLAGSCEHSNEPAGFI
jgi:hypothetical protein